MVKQDKLDLLTSTVVSDREGFEFITRANIGVRRPQKDNFNEQRRFCAFRIRATPYSSDRRFYISMKANGEDIYISFSDSHGQVGWAAAPNDKEFRVMLPHLDDAKWHTILVEFPKFAPHIGDSPIVKGFRLRPGLKVSHVFLFDDKPIWLSDAEDVTP